MNISTEKYLDICKNNIILYYKEHGINITKDNIFVSWYSKNIQNHKALLGVKNGLYFEFTYNGDKSELYMDIYDKIQKKTIEVM